MQDNGKTSLEKLRVIENRQYWMKIVIKEENRSRKSDTYYATDIIENSVIDNLRTCAKNNTDGQIQPKPLEESYAEVSFLPNLYSIIFIVTHELTTYT